MPMIDTNILELLSRFHSIILSCFVCLLLMKSLKIYFHLRTDQSGPKFTLVYSYDGTVIHKRYRSNDFSSSVSSVTNCLSNLPHIACNYPSALPNSYCALAKRSSLFHPRSPSSKYLTKRQCLT